MKLKTLKDLEFGRTEHEDRKILRQEAIKWLELSDYELYELGFDKDDTKDDLRKWIKDFFNIKGGGCKMNDLKELIGQKIVRIRPITKKEREEEGWDNVHSATSVIELENGVLIYPSSDDEGNCAGTLFGKDSKGNIFYIFSEEIIEGERK